MKRKRNGINYMGLTFSFLNTQKLVLEYSRYMHA
jgi:hypothetical protein